MNDPEQIGLPGHEVMRIGPPVSVNDLIARDEAILAEQYKSTDYADCYLYLPESAPGWQVGKISWVNHDISWCLRPRNLARANKLARHAKRPNGRPRHR